MSKILVDTIDTRSGTTNLTIGSTNSSTVTFENGAVTGHMYPAFLMSKTVNQVISDETYTTVEFNSTILDTDSGYSTSTNKYTIPVAGKYLIFCEVYASSPNNTDGLERYNLRIMKDSDQLAENFYDQRNNPGYQFTNKIQHIDSFSANDTIYVQAFIDVTNGGDNPELTGSTSRSLARFGGYRLGS